MKRFYVSPLAPGLIDILLGYIIVSWLAYRFRHPLQTETELFLNFVPAMLWQ